MSPPLSTTTAWHHARATCPSATLIYTILAVLARMHLTTGILAVLAPSAIIMAAPPRCRPQTLIYAPIATLIYTILAVLAHMHLAIGIVATLAPHA